MTEVMGRPTHEDKHVAGKSYERSSDEESQVEGEPQQVFQELVEHHAARVRSRENFNGVDSEEAQAAREFDDVLRNLESGNLQPLEEYEKKHGAGLTRAELRETVKPLEMTYLYPNGYFEPRDPGGEEKFRSERPREAAIAAKFSEDPLNQSDAEQFLDEIKREYLAPRRAEEDRSADSEVNPAPKDDEKLVAAEESAEASMSASSLPRDELTYSDETEWGGRIKVARPAAPVSEISRVDTPAGERVPLDTLLENEQPSEKSEVDTGRRDFQDLNTEKYREVFQGMGRTDDSPELKALDDIDPLIEKLKENPGDLSAVEEMIEEGRLSTSDLRAFRNVMVMSRDDFAAQQTGRDRSRQADEDPEFDAALEKYSVEHPAEADLYKLLGEIAKTNDAGQPVAPETLRGMFNQIQHEHFPDEDEEDDGPAQPGRLSRAKAALYAMPGRRGEKRQAKLLSQAEKWREAGLSEEKIEQRQRRRRIVRRAGTLAVAAAGVVLAKYGLDVLPADSFDFLSDQSPADGNEKSGTSQGAPAQEGGKDAQPRPQPGDGMQPETPELQPKRGTPTLEEHFAQHGIEQDEVATVYDIKPDQGAFDKFREMGIEEKYWDQLYSDPELMDKLIENGDAFSLNEAGIQDHGFGWEHAGKMSDQSLTDIYDRLDQLQSPDSPTETNAQVEQTNAAPQPTDTASQPPVETVSATTPEVIAGAEQQAAQTLNEALWPNRGLGLSLDTWYGIENDVLASNPDYFEQTGGHVGVRPEYAGNLPQNIQDDILRRALNYNRYAVV